MFLMYFSKGVIIDFSFPFALLFTSDTVPEYLCCGHSTGWMWLHNGLVLLLDYDLFSKMCFVFKKQGLSRVVCKLKGLYHDFV